MDSVVAAALVAGAASAASASGVRIRAIRSFLWDGRVLAKGDEAEIADARNARALAAWGKVEILPNAKQGPEDSSPKPPRGRPGQKPKEEET
jgi:hypothetical protein